MLPKTKKPMDTEHRPIAVTLWRSKVMCGFYKEKIEEHLKECLFNYENQYGFTKGGRVEHCMYTLNYIVNRTIESKKQRHIKLFFTFIYFRKAFDSVDRKKTD